MGLLYDVKLCFGAFVLLLLNLRSQYNSKLKSLPLPYLVHKTSDLEMLISPLLVHMVPGHQGVFMFLSFKVIRLFYVFTVSVLMSLMPSLTRLESGTSGFSSVKKDVSHLCRWLISGQLAVVWPACSLAPLYELF